MPQLASSFSCGTIVKHRWFSGYWAAPTSEDDGSIDDSSHCEAARAQNDYILAKAPDLISNSNLLLRGTPLSCLIISGCDDPMALSVMTSPHQVLATLISTLHYTFAIKFPPSVSCVSSSLCAWLCQKSPSNPSGETSWSRTAPQALILKLS